MLQRKRPCAPAQPGQEKQHKFWAGLRSANEDQEHIYAASQGVTLYTSYILAWLIITVSTEHGCNAGHWLSHILSSAALSLPAQLPIHVTNSSVAAGSDKSQTTNRAINKQVKQKKPDLHQASKADSRAVVQILL